MQEAYIVATVGSPIMRAINETGAFSKTYLGLDYPPGAATTLVDALLNCTDNVLWPWEWSYLVKGTVDYTSGADSYVFDTVVGAWTGSVIGRRNLSEILRGLVRTNSS